MELFGTAWDGYSAAEKELKKQNGIKDAAGPWASMEPDFFFPLQPFSHLSSGYQKRSLI